MQYQYIGYDRIGQATKLYHSSLLATAVEHSRVQYSTVQYSAVWPCRVLHYHFRYHLARDVTWHTIIQLWCMALYLFYRILLRSPFPSLTCHASSTVVTLQHWSRGILYCAMSNLWPWIYHNPKIFFDKTKLIIEFTTSFFAPLPLWAHLIRKLDMINCSAVRVTAAASMSGVVLCRTDNDVNTPTNSEEERKQSNDSFLGPLHASGWW